MDAAHDGRSLTFDRLHARAEDNRRRNWRRAQVVDLHGAGHAPDARLAAHLAALGPVDRRHCGAHAMAINQSGDDTSVEHVARPGHERWPRLEPAHGLVAVPIALDL